VPNYAPAGQSIIPAGNVVYLLAHDNDSQVNQDLKFITAASVTSFFSKLKGAWNEIKQAAAKVAQVV
jgi:hypothetical protein